MSLPRQNLPIVALQAPIHNTDDIVYLVSEGKSPNFEFKIRLNDKLLLEIDKTLSDKNPSQVVSLIGSTHSGKSFLIKNLLQVKNKEPTVGGTSMKPTTANVQLYNNGEVQYLDVEGEGGGNALPVTLQSKETFDKHYFAARRKAINEHLPRLAYIVSDVIIYISTLDFSDHRYVEDLMKIARDRCLSGLVDAEKPCLILVSNKYSDIGTLSPDELTKEFLDVQGDELLNYYEDVKCIRLPFNRPNTPEARTFQIQLKSLSEILKNSLKKRLALRQSHGNLFTQQMWGKLLYSAVYQFHTVSNLRMSILYAQSMTVTTKPVAIKAAQLFFFLLTSSTTENYVTSREHALRYLGVLIVEQEATTPTLVQEIYKSFLALIDGNQPCQGVYNKEVRCTQSKRTHSAHHLNPEAKIYTGNMIFRAFKRLASISTTSWPGSFTFKDPQDDKFMRKVFNEGLQINKKSVQAAKYEIFLRAVDRNNLSGYDFTTTPDVCRMCLTRDNLMKNLNCHHDHFCEVCLSPDGTVPSLFSSDMIRLGTCPLCLH